MSHNWTVFPHPRRSSSLRLFCFPYSGSGPHAYFPWREEMPEEIEIVAIQLPGHGSRIQEKPWEDFHTLIVSLSEALIPHLTRPCAFFGHSIGALICFEVARQLRRLGREGPRRIFVAGRQAPHLPAQSVQVRTLGQTEFIELLRQFRGTPEALLQNQELLELFLPVIRADFLLSESYVYSRESPLECGISAFGGLEDEWVGHDEVSAWKEHTGGPFHALFLPGHHFFIHTSQSLLLQALCDELLIKPRPVVPAVI